MKFKKNFIFFKKTIDKIKKAAIIPRHTCETNLHKKTTKYEQTKKI